MSVTVALIAAGGGIIVGLLKWGLGPWAEAWKSRNQLKIMEKQRGWDEEDRLREERKSAKAKAAEKYRQISDSS